MTIACRPDHVIMQEPESCILRPLALAQQRSHRDLTACAHYARKAQLTLIGLQGTYYEAVCQSIDPVAKTVTAAFPESSELDKTSFTLSYDALVLGAPSLSLWTCLL